VRILFPFVAVCYGLSKIVKECHQGVHSTPTVDVLVVNVDHGQFDLLQVFFYVAHSSHGHDLIIVPITIRLGVGGKQIIRGGPQEGGGRREGGTQGGGGG
jgi:hypothetical protein